jgi:hypothetical protein
MVIANIRAPGRRDAIVMDGHFHDRHFPSRFHRGANFLEQASVCRDVEMVDEVGRQHSITAGAKSVVNALPSIELRMKRSEGIRLAI